MYPPGGQAFDIPSPAWHLSTYQGVLHWVQAFRVNNTVFRLELSVRNTEDGGGKGRGGEESSFPPSRPYFTLIFNFPIPLKNFRVFPAWFLGNFSDISCRASLQTKSIMWGANYYFYIKKVSCLRTPWCVSRDGSDYSASILGKLLQASSVQIWTDVDGVLSADPRKVPEAKVLTEVRDLSFHSSSGGEITPDLFELPLSSSALYMSLQLSYNDLAPGILRP